MIIPDLNLLMYAYNPEAQHHAVARLWWENLLRSGSRVGIPWIVVLGFIRLSTTRGVMQQPVSPNEALRRVNAWFSASTTSYLNPGRRHMEILRTMLEQTPGGALTTDAHLAALAIEHQAELHSNDSDFARFGGLRWFNPLDV